MIDPIRDLIDALAERAKRSGFIGFRLADPDQPRPRQVSGEGLRGSGRHGSVSAPRRTSGMIGEQPK